jgi:hypothetical protein
MVIAPLGSHWFIVPRCRQKRSWDIPKRSQSSGQVVFDRVIFHDFPLPCLITTEYQWIGLKENLQETQYSMGKSMVSCRFSLKPIH